MKTKKESQRSLDSVLNEISETIANQSEIEGVTGYAIRWRTVKGATLQMQWGKLKQSSRPAKQGLGLD